MARTARLRTTPASSQSGAPSAASDGDDRVLRSRPEDGVEVGDVQLGDAELVQVRPRERERRRRGR